jgi:hypothetical protein
MILTHLTDINSHLDVHQQSDCLTCQYNVVALVLDTRAAPA